MPLPELSIVLPTYNRAATLRGAVDALLRQQPADGTIEIVVIDNNSSDATPEVLSALGDPRVVVIRETRQGLSHARNAGIAAARAEIVAFTDDDVEVPFEWAATIVRTLRRRPDVDGIGGRVLPSWPGTPPGWLTRAHWAPLALQDHGEALRIFDATNPIGLVGANVAFRRAVFERIGPFAEHVQRVADGIGSTEDHELLCRLYTAGGRMLYVPELIVTARVQTDRCDRAYHRRWHEGHGRFSALMRMPDVERARVALFGVPGHLLRSAAADAAAWLRSSASADWEGAFLAELRLRFFKGFVRGRVAE
jgi:glycosyltransferase involved in cell wall biosynthesis